MKTPLLLAGMAAMILAFPVEGQSNSSGAPAGRSGAPPEGGATCNASGCHFGSAVNSGSGSITVTGPMTYRAGQTLDLTITVAQEGAQRIGFQVSAIDEDAGTHTGTWTLVDSQTRFAGGNQNYVTHQDAPSGSSSRTFSVQWTAPSNTVGSVLLYIAGNAANGNGSSTGDQIYTLQYPLAESSASVDRDPLPSHFRVSSTYPNPAEDRAVVALDLPEARGVTLRLMDMLGREISARRYDGLGAGSHELTVSTAGLASGVYVLVAESASGTIATQRLVVR